MSLFPQVARAAVASIALAGCALFSSPAPEPCKTAPLVLELHGSELQNLNSDGQAMPVEVKAFILADRPVFDQLDLDTVYTRGKEVLGGEVLADASFTVFPKEEKLVTLEAPVAASYVALVAFFRQPDGDRWKQVVDIKKVIARCAPGQLHAQIKATLVDNRMNAPEQVE